MEGIFLDAEARIQKRHRAFPFERWYSISGCEGNFECKSFSSYVAIGKLLKNQSYFYKTPLNMYNNTSTMELNMKMCILVKCLADYLI